MLSGVAFAEPPSRPNILFVLADDLGIGDVGVFWQNARSEAGDAAAPWHRTPHFDALARGGLQLRQHYCSAPVCAPSRASFLLGVHQGHANVRDNQFDKALEDNHTVASVLKQAGYATACIGKWGLQGKRSKAATNGWPGHPMNRGFEYYFGYIGHGHGHKHYPKEDGKPLYDGTQEVSAEFDGCYTTDLFTARTKKWIGDHCDSNSDQPFFLYLAFDTPHAILQLPPGPFPPGGGRTGGVQWLGEPGQMINTAGGEPDTYCHPDYVSATWDHDNDASTPEQPWPDVYQRYATDVRRIDDCVGDLMQFLRDLELEHNTLVVFTSDNGPSKESYLEEPYKPTFFDSYGPHDGIKRDLWEGGIRVGALVHWPAGVPAGRVSDQPCAFWDWMPTFADIAGVPTPARSDGVSLTPTLRGAGNQPPPLTYIEYAQGGKTPGYDEFTPEHQGRRRRQMQAIRVGDLMGVRYNIESHADPFEIYDVVTDPQQTKNLADQPEFEAVQRQISDRVLRVRRPNTSARRPYDNELVPPVHPACVEPGLQWRGYQESFPWVARLEELQPSVSGRTRRPNLAEVLGEAATGALFQGFIDAPVDGEYIFHLTTDGGALLRIHEAVVVDADFGYQPGAEASGAIRLQAGKHPMRLYYRSGPAGDRALDFEWSSDRMPRQKVPAEALFSDDNAAEKPQKRG
ncbi:sulfatase-like hydrolase/transferase [Posidoniimonas polymericola]|uniref:sulfatase-like hydrolase/transferase n=1 Tax=Posidoniimonas polymericola TaxID=2528002 RepID=UPI001E54DB32|nr:sulfatase-like hydrolase/transferase [Posidoniimonas polymericola]